MLKRTIFAGLAVLVGPSLATAAEVSFAGFTNGCYTSAASCMPATNPASTTVSFLGLTYENSTFSGTTSGGFLGVGAQGQVPPSANVNNFGSFTLSSAPNDYNTGEHFDLLVTFQIPASSNPPSALFTDVITGSVSGQNNGGVFIQFDPTPKTFTFAGGSFTVSVNNVSVNAGNTVALSGNIVARTTNVPEPVSLAVLGTGLLGLGMLRRKKL